MEKLQNSYIEEIKNYAAGKSHKKDHEIYKYLWAVKMDMILYEDCPPEFFKKHTLSCISECGIDLIGKDLLKLAHVEYCDKILFDNLKKYVSYCLLSELSEICVLTTKNAIFEEILKRKFEENPGWIQRRSMKELFKETVGIEISEERLKEINKN